MTFRARFGRLNANQRQALAGAGVLPPMQSTLAGADALASTGFTQRAADTDFPAFRGNGYTSPFRGTRQYPARAPSELSIPRFARPEIPTLDNIDPQQPFHIPTPQSVRDELKYSRFQSLPFSIGTASAKVLNSPPPDTRRVYLLVVNTSALNLLYVAFGQDATTTIGVPVMLNFGFWEFEMVVPQDDIYLIAAGASTTGVLVYSNKGLRA